MALVEHSFVRQFEIQVIESEIIFNTRQALRH